MKHESTPPEDATAPPADATPPAPPADAAPVAEGRAQKDLFPDLFCPAPPPADLTAAGEKMHQVAPGIWATSLPEFETPSHILCRLVPAATPGTFTLQPEPYPGYVRMQTDVGRKLGVFGLSDTTMRRLLAIGFVEHMRPAIGCILISIESLLEHFRRTRNDLTKDHSWWTKERRELWRQVIEGGCNLEDGY
jgi:hypothetical protein